FCQLDDYDILSSIKAWMHHPDKILSTLSRWLINRKLLHLTLQNQPVNDKYFKKLQNRAAEQGQLSPAETHYFVFHGTATNKNYDIHNEEINILFKIGRAHV